MATWRDGPEYAPRERPEAFVEPPAAALETPPPAENAGLDAPGELPAFAAPQGPMPDLATLIPSTLEGRDPAVPFEVVSSPMTTPTAWGAAHSTAAPGTQPLLLSAWSPQQPFAASAPLATASVPPPAPQPHAPVNPQQFPAPGTPQWFTPPPDPRQQPVPQVSFNQVWKAVTPGVVISLLIGAVLGSFSILMLGLAYGMASRIPYRRQQVQALFGGSAGLVVLVGLWSLVTDDFYLNGAWDNASTAARLCCLLLPFALGLVVALALTRGEKPGSQP